MSIEKFDVLIVGAGISGIGSAHHLQEECPDKSYVILEGREAIGGTWDLFRYPGIRSDSDMYTLGYKFKPWLKGKVLAEGALIKEYVEEAAADGGINQHIRFGHRVVSASWSSEDSAWTIEALRTDTNQTVYFQCNMLLMCSGYYKYKEGYTPDFEGMDDFQGEIVHPQKWPDTLDHTNKKVVVIGSGATAASIVPAIAADVEHVTMLQRSPTYYFSTPENDLIANFLLRWFPENTAYRLIRWRNIFFTDRAFKKARNQPETIKTQLLDQVKEYLGDDYDIDTHFTPNYNPWDQRLCLLPDGDLFQAINSGKASVTTDHIERFTEDGILLKSGDVLEADIIVTATGLNLRFLGGVQFEVDGEPVEFGEQLTYMGVMVSNVPNLIYTFGYVNASWTLRADLVAEFSCNIINHMDQNGTSKCMPQLRPEDVTMERSSVFKDYSSGYFARGWHLFPRQGEHAPWVAPQDYKLEQKLLGQHPMDDGVLTFSRQEQVKESAVPV
ncbi:MAG: NAD(P)/FAD-dependent oxidoreductase [Chloroflexota bacterium]